MTETPADALAAETPAPAARRGGGLARMRVPRWFVLFPAAVYFAFFFAPNLFGTWYAFTDWNGFNATPPFIGLSNFRSMWSDPLGRGALTHTLVIAGCFVVVVNGLGIALAVSLNRLLKTRNVLRLLFFAPAAMSPLAVAYIWQFILQPDGPLNEALRKVGLGSLAQGWLGQPSTALAAVVLTLVWQYSGLQMAIYLAGLQSIPDELYEASALDGAGPVRQFLHVTLPQLLPAAAVAVTLALIGGLKVFDQVIALTGGGPGGATQTLATQVYQQAFQVGRLGYSAALALVLTLTVIVVAAVQMALMRRLERAY